MTYPHLSRAPIVEGLIDIQVKPRADLSVQSLLPLVEMLKTSYPTTKDLRSFHAKVTFDPAQEAVQSVDSKQVGYRFERQAPNFVILARLGGITISRLKPYDTWESLIAEARRHWEAYREVSKPETITRIATRFINRMELPMDGLDFDDYLAAPPRIPKGLPQEIGHFLTRIVLSDRSSGSSIAIAQALEAPNFQEHTVPVLFDIDVYKEVDIPVDSEEPWTLLGRMRDLKNCAFFDSLTPRALELYQ